MKLYFCAVIIVSQFLFGCVASKVQLLNGVPFKKSYNLQPTDYALIFDGDSIICSNLVDSFKINNFLNVINSSISTNENIIWKGGFFLSVNGVELKISYYGNFFKDIRTGIVYVVDNEYTKEYNAFRSTIVRNKIKPYRNKKNKNTSNLE